MKKHLIYLGYIVLAVTAHLTAQSQGTTPSVTLTVEGRGSLVSEQCPGTVKISCNGVDLSFLRWRFNGSRDVITFFSAPSPFTNNPAFISAELLSTARNQLDPSIANFSSELVVDVSKLETESITSITCGDPDTFKMIPVDVEIIQETEPESPNETNVTALYEDGSLTDVSVSWEKLESRCPVFQSSLVYQIQFGSSVVAVNHTSCEEVCIISFQNFSGASEEYRVSLSAVNAIGASTVVEHPTIIMKQSSFYFTPMILSNDCLFVSECFSNGSVDTNSCNVLYTTDSMYRDPTIIVSPLNTQFEIAGIPPNTNYYFEFSVSVNDTLIVRNRLTEKVVSSPRFSVLVIVFLALTILLITIGTAFGIVICVTKQLQRVKTKIVLVMVCLLGILSLIFLTVFSIITGVQQDTCSLVWSKARDALILSAFLFAILGNFFLVSILFVSRQHKKPARVRSQNSNTKPNSSLVQMDTLAESSTTHTKASPEKTKTSPEKTNTASGAKYVIAPLENIDGEQKSSQKKKGGLFTSKFTVYKLVVRLKDRSYLVFKRYSEFETLFGEIKKSYPSEDKLKLPGKKPLKNKFDPNFIEERRIGLQDFIINLMKISNILEFLPVREFLAINDPRSALPIKDKSADEGRVKEADKVNLGEKEDTTAKITDFDLLNVIEGTTCVKVYLCRGKENGDFYAIKVLKKKAIIKRSEFELTLAKRSVAIHPFLVGLHYSFQTTKRLYFLLDYVNGGKLSSYLKNNAFDEPSAKFYAAEITSALGYLHSLDIIYWDLKLKNILLDANGHIMLTDFGLCKEEVTFGETSTQAPEVLRKQEYGYSVDWWCLGVVLYEMLYGQPPSQSHKINCQTPITFSARNLLERLLQDEKMDRLGEIYNAEVIKAHMFFKSINWDDLFYKRLKPPFKPPVKDAALKLGQFGSELTAVVISGTQKHGTEGVPCVSIADDTFNVMN